MSAVALPVKAVKSALIGSLCISTYTSMVAYMSAVALPVKAVEAALIWLTVWIVVE